MGTQNEFVAVLKKKNRYLQDKNSNLFQVKAPRKNFAVKFSQFAIRVLLLIILFCFDF